MDAKTWIINETQKQVEALFRYARATPEDKLTWVPGEGCRSILDMCQECAQAPDWGNRLLSDRKLFDLDARSLAEFRKERGRWNLDDCERVCRERTEILFSTIRGFPESDFEGTIYLPFGAGREWTFAEIMGLHHWNLCYHVGQIAYVQRMFGDLDPH